MKKIENFIEALEGSALTLNYYEMQNAINVRQVIDGLSLEFILHYEVHNKNYIAATYDQPEEYEVEFLPTEIEEIALYKGAEFLELTNDQFNLIENIINEMIF